MNSSRSLSIARLILLALAVAGAALPASAQTEPHLFTYSTLDALLAGAYDGDLTVQELGAKGDFGLGTYNRLDGEMIVLDGVFYHALADGSVVVAGPQEKTPLAYVARFHAVQTLKIESPLTLQELERWTDEHLQNLNLFYAIRIDGVFRDTSVRAIAPQTKPYRPLTEVVKTQSVHDYANTRGVLVGLRSPSFSRGISVPGYHWHYLTADRRHGGHVLKLTLVQGTAQLEAISQMDLQLPHTEAFAQADQTQDRSEEVKRVEGK
jgi:acetolactate decarboxylase